MGHGRKKEQKDKSLLMKAVFYCGKCTKTVEVAADKVHFSASSQECELCGSHGESTVRFTCPECKKGQEVVLDSW